MRPCKSLCTAFLGTACVLAQAQAQQAGAPSQSSYESRARAQQVGTPSLRMEVSPAHAADARSLLDRCEAIRAERVKGVSTYVVDQSIMRNRVLLPYERMDIRGADGRTFPAFRRAREDGPWSREDLQLFAEGARQVGEGLRHEMQSAGFPPVLSGGESPWATTDPGMMMGGVSTFLHATADARDANAAEDKAAAGEAAQSHRDMGAFARRATLVGKERLGLRDTYLLKAQGLNRTLPAQGGQQMTVNDVALWIDAEHCVPLKMTIDGLVRSEGQDRPIAIERIDSRYRAVPGSNMFEPFLQVIRMRGVMTAEQQRELQEARRQLDEMEAQLKQLSPEQRRMLMARVGPQMQMLRNMADGGGVSVATRIHAIHVNPDAAALKRLHESAPVGPEAGRARP